MTDSPLLILAKKYLATYNAVTARPEPHDDTLSNEELYDTLRAQRRAIALLLFMKTGYTDFKGNPVKGEKLVAFALRHSLPLSSIKGTILEAAEADDRAFFVRLGDILKRPAPKLDIKTLDRLRLFLVRKWLHCDDNCKLLHDPSRSLCYYPEKAIAEICRVVLGLNALEVGTVTQARQRLGLRIPKRWRRGPRKFEEAPKDAKTLFSGWRELLT